MKNTAPNPNGRRGRHLRTCPMMTWAPPWPFFALACLVVATLVLSTALLDSSKAADMPITTSRVTVQVFGGGIP